MDDASLSSTPTTAAFGNTIGTKSCTNVCNRIVEFSDDSSKIFIGSLPSQVCEIFLFQYMSYFGRVKSVNLKRNAKTGQSRRYGYVKFFPPGPREDIFDNEWYIGEKRIRIKRYQTNPCWKNEYYSAPEETDEDVVPDVV